MPATTRSATAQTKLEDFGAGSKETIPKAKKSPATNPTKKRQPAEPSHNPALKRRKPASAAEHREKGDEVITINRGPVLELWSSSVAELLHPSLSWETCLSIGGAIATITAVSKGRSIGAMAKPDPEEAEKKKEERREKVEKEGMDEVEVMGFKLRLDRDGNALVGGNAKKASEEALRKKFGNEQYDLMRGAFRDVLQEWNGREEELEKRAFGFYEAFRPSVASGQKGWGRKGELRLERVRATVRGE